VGMSAYTRTTVRRGRKPRRCDTGTDRCSTISPGELYLEHVAAPNHTDLGNQRWWRMAECGGCAAVCGRPIPGYVTTPDSLAAPAAFLPESSS
jgi:hypothetical protein